MRGDSILTEPPHRKAAKGIAPIVLKTLASAGGRIGVTIAGESGCGKSEVAAALAAELEKAGVPCAIIQQDDYFIHPPRTNDKTRRADITWVGPQEVKLDLMNAHMQAFIDGANALDKPLVDYAADAIVEETLDVGGARVLIADGTYTTLLDAATCRVFIDVVYTQTRKHREDRKRDASELDDFIDGVLQIEHGIISAHKAHADIIVNEDYSVSPAA